MNNRPQIIDDDKFNEAWLSKDRRPAWKARVNHASKIGHPCDRYLVLQRVAGDKAIPPSKRLEAIFRRGTFFEQLALEQLHANGWQTWDEQRQFDLIEKGEVILSCRIDCIAKSPDNGEVYVVDHKTVNPYDWDKIPSGWEGYDYLRNSDKPWLKSWPAQIQAYIYNHPAAASSQTGILQLINPEVPLSKFVYVPFDPEYMQGIIDRCHLLNRHVKDYLGKGPGTLPAPIDWDEGVCGRCELLNVCLPDQAAGRTPLELVMDDSFIALLDERTDLAKQKLAIEKQYKAVHDRVKHLVGDRAELAAGPYIIRQKEVSVPERVQKAFTYMRMDVKNLAPKEVEEPEEGVA